MESSQHRRARSGRVLRARAPLTALAACALSVALAACASDARPTSHDTPSTQAEQAPRSSQPTTTPTATPTAAPTAAPTATPAFEGFDLPLQTGTYWDFGWDDASSAFQAGGGVSRSSSHERGSFRVVLGDPRVIEGVRVYALRTEKTGGDDARVTTAWKYLGSEGNRLIGSLDGTSLRTVLDAQHGTQAGGGFFGDPWPTSRRLTVVRANIDNAFVKGDALVLSTSSREGGCETFSGVGTICSDRSENTAQRDYFRAGVGPLGYYGFSSYSSGSGGASSTLNIGLIRVDFQGPPPLVVLPTPSPRPGLTRSTDATGTFSVDLPQELASRRLTPTAPGGIPTIRASTDLSLFARLAAPGVEVRVYPRVGDLAGLARTVATAYASCQTVRPAEVTAAYALIEVEGCGSQGGRGLIVALNDDADLVVKRSDVTLGVILFVTAGSGSRYSTLAAQLLGSLRYADK